MKDHWFLKMSNLHATGGFLFPRIYIKNNKNVINKFKEGNIEHVELSQWNFVDEFFGFLLNEKFFIFADKSYPNPRKLNFVPIWFLIASQFIMRIYGSHKYHDLKFFLNSGSILTKLGFNVSNNITNGFNNRNKYQRKTQVDQDTVRKYFKDTNPLLLREWHNHSIQKWFKNNKVFDKDGIFILDQTKIVVPKNENYQDATYLPVDEFGHFYPGYASLSDDEKFKIPKRPCYTLTCLIHLSKADDFVHVAAYDIGSGSVDELEQAKKIISQFYLNFPGLIKLLIMDRGYIDGEWISDLKNSMKIDIIIPLKKSMDNFKDAFAIAKLEDKWIETENVVDKNKLTITKTSKVENVDLWNKCDIFMNVYPSMTYKIDRNSKEEESYSWALTSTIGYSEKDVIFYYNLRTRIEETFRQLKESWGLKKFESPNKGLIESHFCFIFITYSAFQLYLRSKELKAETNKFISTLRNSERFGNNAIAVYTEDSFGILHLDACFSLMAEMGDTQRLKIKDLMSKQKMGRELREKQ